MTNALESTAYRDPSTADGVRRGRSQACTPTLADVAREAGVSPMTVSNFLNGRYKQSAHREAIEAAVSRLDYQIDPHAQRLASGFSPRAVGLFSLNIDLGVALLQLSGIQSRLRKLGYTVPLDVYNLHTADTEVDLWPLGVPEVHHVQSNADPVPLVRALCRQRPIAIVFQTSFVSREALQEFRAYQESGGLVVSYGDAVADLECDQVLFDENENSYRAALALIKQGHKRIGFRSHGYPQPDNTRVQGFLRALREYGLPEREEWMFTGLLYEEGGAQLADDFLALKDRPTGLCIVNDNTASAFVQQVIRRGWRVPEDVSVVGHDNTMPSQYCIVPLTTAAYPVAEIVNSVVEMVASRLDGAYTGPPRREKFCGEVIERESVIRPRSTSRNVLKKEPEGVTDPRAITARFRQKK